MNPLILESSTGIDKAEADPLITPVNELTATDHEVMAEWSARAAKMRADASVLDQLSQDAQRMVDARHPPNLSPVRPR